MRSCMIRLLIAVAIIGGSWLVYQLADVTKCSGPQSQQWAETSLQRVTAANADLNYVTVDTTPYEYDTLSTRAKARFTEQQDQSAPACLSDFQKDTSDALFYEWKFYESATAGNFDLASTELNSAAAARDAMQREYYSLAAKYNWDTSK
jgi:hypothetical protein